jgi:hypothetical protein
VKSMALLCPRMSTLTSVGMPVFRAAPFAGNRSVRPPHIGWAFAMHGTVSTFLKAKDHMHLIIVMY